MQTLPRSRAKVVPARPDAAELAARAADRVGRPEDGAHCSWQQVSRVTPSGPSFVEWLEEHGF